MNAGKNSSERERLTDLVVEQATCGLNLAGQDELSSLMDQLKVTSSEMQLEAEQMELAVAAADLASFRCQTEPLPPKLRDVLLLRAGQHFLGKRESTEVAGMPIEEHPLRLSEESKVDKRPTVVSRPNWREILSILAAAACILVLVANRDKVFSGKETTPTVAQLEKKFLESNPRDLVNVSWAPGTDQNGSNVSGQLTWSTQEQTGFMRFQGLKKNDPSVEQYQLWIFETPDQKYPIDGGVFDVSDQESRIRIDPKIKVGKGAMFAVTVEKSGGVVVSDRLRIAALAKPD